MIAPPPLTEPTGGPWPGHPLFSLESLYRAYRQCRRRKRHTHNALAFERDLEANLLTLHEALEGGTYVPRPSLAFLVTKPKPREIFAADFRDRVVHHLLVGHLEPRWERRFIHDSYACRRGKGTH
jgi:retron-type reverse transcriptase